MNTQSQREDRRFKYRQLLQLLDLAWPIVVQLLSFSAMTLVDTLFVGRLGASALAAVGLGGMAVFSIAAFGIGAFAGAKVKVSEACGRADTERTQHLLGVFVRCAVIFSLVLTPLAWLTSWAIQFVSSDPMTADLAGQYAAVLSSALPVLIFVTAIGQFRQGTGDSRTAMRAALWANLANIPLNAVFIFALDLGVLGAGLATASARIVELCVLVHIQRQSGFGVSPSWDGTKAVLSFSLSTGFERWLDVAAFAALVALLGRMGPTQVAAHQIALQVLHFSFLPLIAISEALSVRVAQAVGAQRRASVTQFLRAAWLLGLVYSVVTGALFLLFKAPILAIFTRDQEVLRAAESVLAAGVLLQVLHAIYSVQKGVLRGLSDVRFVAWTSVACAWLFTPPLTYAFHAWFSLGAAGGWLALSVEVFVGVGILRLRMSRNPWLSRRTKPRPKVALATAV